MVLGNRREITEIQLTKSEKKYAKIMYDFLVYMRLDV